MLPILFSNHQFLFQVHLLSWSCSSSSEPTVLVFLKLSGVMCLEEGFGNQVRILHEVRYGRNASESIAT